MIKKLGVLLMSLLLIGYITSINSASFYMLKGFTNAEYLNISANSFVLQYPINSVATTPINVYATYIPYNAFGNATTYLTNLKSIMLSGINGSTFEGNLSFIPYQNGILVPEYTLQGSAYKTLAFYYNTNYNNVNIGYSYYTNPPFVLKLFNDTLQNNYRFIYLDFKTGLDTSNLFNAQTIPAQPNNATNTAGNFKVSFNQLNAYPYFLITTPNTTYTNLTYYRGTGVVARQITALYTNSVANLLGNKIGFSIYNTSNNGLLLAPNSQIWLGYLDMPLYYTNYTLHDGATTSSVNLGLYYTNYNYILNILMPNTQKVYSTPSNFYFLIPAYATANAVLVATNTTTPPPSLPLFEYQFNLTNINWTMQPSAWLNWSGGYNIHNFNTLNTTQNPSFTTKYLMFSLPAYPCLQTTDGNYGAIQVYAYRGNTNLGRVPIAEWQKQGNSVYYVMPNTTTKGLTYSNAVAYICTPQPIQSQLNSSLAAQFVIAKDSGSGNANPNQYLTSQTDGVLFVNPKLFYGNEYFSLWDTDSAIQYSMVKAQSLSLNGSAAYNPSTSTYVKILANYPLYITYARQAWTGAYVGELWFGGGMVNLPSYIAEYSNFPVFASNSTATKSYTWLSNILGVSLNVSLPYNASMTLVNYFTTKYAMGNLSAITTTSSNNSSGVSNPVITPSSPKLNLTITNSTIAANIATLNSQFNKSVALFGVNVPLGAVYIIVLIMIIVLALVAKTEGAVPLVLAVMWFAGLIFMQELIIAAIITLVYATYKAEGLFK